MVGYSFRDLESGFLFLLTLALWRQISKEYCPDRFCIFSRCSYRHCIRIFGFVLERIQREKKRGQVACGEVVMICVSCCCLPSFFHSRQIQPLGRTPFPLFILIHMHPPRGLKTFLLAANGKVTQMATVSGNLEIPYLAEGVETSSFHIRSFLINHCDAVEPLWCWIPSALLYLMLWIV